MKKIIYSLLFITALLTRLQANNVNITGVTTAGSSVSFNISWDNSWNAGAAPTNWDGVWLFIKYQDCVSPTVWDHAIVAAGSTAGAPLMVENVADARGIFVRRSAPGVGNIVNVPVTINVTVPMGTYNIKVFGIEMVYAPTGNFEIGDNATSTNAFANTTITAVNQAGGIGAGIIGGGAAPNVALPSSYPMGYNGFYCMKYEVTQEQYVNFLNCLDYTQQASRVALLPNVAPLNYAMYNWVGPTSANGICVSVSGLAVTTPAVYACNLTLAAPLNNTNDGQNKACNFLSWGDLSAYLDWAALRPITELEYEKVCRGFAGRVSGEYVWGNNVTITGRDFWCFGGMINNYLNNEALTAPVNGPCNYGCATACNSGPNSGPVRVGAAANAGTTRVTAGAAYFGSMEMAGNVWEQVVNVNTATGAVFTGLNGDGVVAVNGDANTAGWPSPGTGLGTGVRGGGFNSAATTCRISDRSSINTPFPARNCIMGGRGGRTY